MSYHANSTYLLSLLIQLVRLVQWDHQRHYHLHHRRCSDLCRH